MLYCDTGIVVLCVPVSRLSRLASWVSGSTHGVHAMTLTPNLAWYLKTTSAYRRMLTDGCAPSTELTATVATLPVLRCRAILYPLCQENQKGRWKLQRVTQYSCTSVLERGATHLDRFIGGDFRSVINFQPNIAKILFFFTRCTVVHDHNHHQIA